MNKIPFHALGAAALLLLSIAPLVAQTGGNMSSELTPSAVLSVMQRVGDWQLANPATNRPTGWIQGVGDLGMMALAGISGDAKYRDAMFAKGETNGWELPQPKGRRYHADDQCIGQTWTELYFLYRENRMIAPMRERFDWILANPPKTQSLDHRLGEDQWTWCDALFMAPPAWLRLYAATGDARYRDFAVTNFWRTTDYLYDKDEHLFFRDSTYFKKTGANGQKVFWSRGNGWVLAGIVRALQYLPMNSPDRPRFEQLFKDMADKIVSLQQPDGLWRASLLDAEDYPTPEASGSALFTYGLAWGVNQGLLDRAKFEPAVRKAWPALVGCVNADGRLTHVQPAGTEPVKFSADATSPYGGGVFLLAGSEVYRMGVMEWVHHYSVELMVPPPGHFLLTGHLAVKVTNPAAFRRDCETAEFGSYDGGFLTSNDIGVLLNHSAAHKVVVMDGVSSRVLDSQVDVFRDSQTDRWIGRLLFQVDLAPGETRTFYILDASALAAVPPPIVKTMARFVPERYDDFAWESDRIAHRAYGLALIPAEHTVSSGPDVWIKKNHILIVDTMYATKHYHEDNGEFMDDYRVGNSRGCGGIGIWDGTKLHVSSNYHDWKLITTGPVRSEFELTYDAWDAGNGRMVSETKCYSIDAGSYFTKAQSTFASDDKSPLTVAVGLAERACPTNREESITHDQDAGWLAYWQPEDQPKGVIGDAIILAKGTVQEFTNDNPNLPDAKLHANVPQPTHEGYPPIRNMLAITKAEVGRPLTYYFGACWDRSGDFTNAVQWEDYVKRFAERRDQPLQVTVGN
jgi:rhamnogalacturonyl hydrolase YesR